MKNQTYLILTYIFLFTGLIHAQEDADALYSKAGSEFGKYNYSTAIQYYKQSLELRLQHPFIEPDNLEIIRQKTINSEDKTIDKIAKTYRNIGSSHYRDLHFPKALKYLTFSIDMYQLTDTSAYKRKDLANAYYNLALVYDDLGEYQRAIEVADEAFRLYAGMKNNRARGVIMTLNLLADFHRNNGNHEQSIILCEKGETLYHSLSKDDKDKYRNKIARIYHTWGIALDEQKKYESALSYYRKALEYDISDPEITENGIAWSLIQLNRLNKAEEKLHAVINKKRKKHETPYHYNYSATFENFAELEISKKDYKSALNYFQLALINLTDNFRNEDINTNPKATDNHYIYNKPHLIQVLHLKAQAALKSGNTDLAYHTYQELDEWINEFYKDLDTKASKLEWIARAHNIYGNAIKVALLKKDEEKAFEYAEKAHAVLLWQSLSQQAARNILSKDEQEKMDNLNAKIRQADQQYRYEEISINALRRLERERDALEAKLDKKYPDYAQRKYQPETTTVKDIQSKIIDDYTAFIEYYQTDEVLYIFTITKNGIEITQKNADGLADEISDFVDNISETENYLASRGDNISTEKFKLEDYHKSAYKLYQQLIPSTIQSNDKINRLVIVPDREISHFWQMEQKHPLPRQKIHDQLPLLRRFILAIAAKESQAKVLFCRYCSGR